MVRKPGEVRFFGNDIRFGVKRQQHATCFSRDKRIKELSQERCVQQMGKIHMCELKVTRYGNKLWSLTRFIISPFAHVTETGCWQIR